MCFYDILIWSTWFSKMTLSEVQMVPNLYGHKFIRLPKDVRTTNTLNEIVLFEKNLSEPTLAARIVF
jgi:hypothetical protein